MNYDTILGDLHAVHDRAGRFRQRVDKEPVKTTLAGVLQELDVALEELRVTEEEITVQHEALEDVRGSVEAERECFQSLFHLAPVAYLVTDRFGAIREANLRAAELLGIEGQFLAGQAAGIVRRRRRPLPLPRPAGSAGAPGGAGVAGAAASTGGRERPGDDVGGRRSGR